jgi:hypothetical protein
LASAVRACDLATNRFGPPVNPSKDEESERTPVTTVTPGWSGVVSAASSVTAMSASTSRDV